MLKSFDQLQAGWFPTYTLGEDMALALEVQKEGWKGAYVKEYLAIGEVPETIRNAFMQKSRWCKGGMQIFFSRHNALFARNLSLMQRIVWNTSGWSYICTTITTPVFLVSFACYYLFCQCKNPPDNHSDTDNASRLVDSQSYWLLYI